MTRLTERAESLTPYEQTLVLLLTAGIPISTIEPATVQFWLKQGKTPVEIARDVWSLRPEQLRKES